MRYLMLFFAASTVFLACIRQANADEAIGYVKKVSGEAWITTGTTKVQAVLGTPVFQGSQLKTGANSSLGVTFKDETLMSFGPNTELTVDTYLFAPTKGKLKLAAKMAKGTLNYLSGTIAKLQPEAVTVATPSGIIGVRGTQFLAKVE